jgi:hypothetical protein
VALAGPLLGLAACTQTQPPDFQEAVNPLRPQITVSPHSVAPGDQVALRFPADNRRSLILPLYKRVGNSWEKRYFLGPVENPRRDRASWWSLDQPVADILLQRSGPGAEYAVIPDVAEPGDYLLCTGSHQQKVCGRLTVTPRH